MNLGHVTAYAYAKTKGYTGTADEFAEMMAGLPQYATQASASAIAAAESATTASNKIDAADALITAATNIENQRFEKKYTVSSSTSSFTFDPTGYTYTSGDRFEVYVDGAKLTDDAYSNSSATITLGTAVSSGTVEIICYRDVTFSTDATLSIQGAAADSKKTGDQISNLKDDLSNIEGISDDVKTALLACFEHVAWIDDDGQDYYDALESAMNPKTLLSINAVFTQGQNVIYADDDLETLRQYLVVTANYADSTSAVVLGYVLSGTLTEGTSTITVTYEGKTDTFTVIVSAAYWDYKWDASSHTLPNDMTADSYDFTTESGALYAKQPNLDFGVMGSYELEVTCKFRNTYESSGDVFYSGNNSQLQILSEEVSTGVYRGIKLIANSSLNPDNPKTYAGIAVGINGTNAYIPGVNGSEYHTYNVKCTNGVYSLNIDGDAISLTQNNNTTQYLDFTGIVSAVLTNGIAYMFIKSIKMRSVS